jgi:glycosyltransferase involved in cell wall biosynthesis
MAIRSDMFRISIVTVTLNSEEYLEQAIQSVAAQTYPNIEHIVIDGGSTDTTLDIIDKHEQRINRWISEPDDGIADAMNKGISLATGDFIFFLNSDDYLEPDTFSQVCRNLTLENDIYLCGIYLEKSGAKKYYKPGRFGLWTNFKLGMSHQSIICSQSLFDSIGYFDASFSLTMDYDFFLRAYRRGIRPVRVDLPIATMRLIGLTSQTDWPSLRRRFLEERRVHLSNCEPKWMRLIYEIYWLLYWPYRRFRSMASISGKTQRGIFWKFS